jgi:cytochrome o ubiquinol oxidase subunit 2
MQAARRRGIWISLLACGLPRAALAAGGWPLLDPQGPIGADEQTLILTAIGLMLLVVVPVIVMTFVFAWKYRATSKAARYTPKWDFSAKIETVVWLIPAAIVTILGILAWKSSHDLNPYDPIPSAAAPVRIEAVSLDWKWLFIYQDLDVATVNRLVVPTGVPLSFRITSDTVMTSFFIPQLGSQIYAMGGMQTRLNLVADKAGTYAGLNSQYSGSGFSDMNFKTVATSRQDFDAWLKRVRQSPNALDAAAFRRLEAPTRNNPVVYFASVKPHLFDDIIRKYMNNIPVGGAGRPGDGAAEEAPGNGT